MLSDAILIQAAPAPVDSTVGQPLLPNSLEWCDGFGISDDYGIYLNGKFPRLAEKRQLINLLVNPCYYYDGNAGNQSVRAVFLFYYKQFKVDMSWVID